MTTAEKNTKLSGAVARLADDPDLRQLLRDNPMEGQISLRFEREPSFFDGSSIEGDHHQTAIVRMGDKLVGLGTRSSRLAWLNGQVDALGYLSQLRVASQSRGPGVLRAGFKTIRALHDNDDCKLYVTTIIEDNALARRLLEGNWKFKPTYEKRGVLSSLVLPLSRYHRSTVVPGVEVRNATASDIDEIASCLQRNYASYQFAPYWTAQMLSDPSTVRGLHPKDFQIAIREGKVIGVLALWDQRRFKQTVVHGYSGYLARFRKLLNIFKPITGLPHFPPPGDQFHHLYISHVAVDNEDNDVFLSLLGRAFNSSRGRGYSYITLGFCEGNSLLEATKRKFRNLEYRSIVYLVFYKESAALARKMVHKTPHLEIAVL